MENRDTKIWINKYQEKINIEEMADDYLHNSLKLFRKKRNNWNYLSDTAKDDTQFRIKQLLMELGRRERMKITVSA